MYKRKIEENLDCGIRVANKVFGGKWKCCILDAIDKGINRPAEISRYIGEASIRIIEMQLAELLFYGAVEKCAEDVYPKKSEYKLTALGESIRPVLMAMDKWGSQHASLIKERHRELQD